MTTVKMMMRKMRRSRRNSKTLRIIQMTMKMLTKSKRPSLQTRTKLLKRPN